MMTEHKGRDWGLPELCIYCYSLVFLFLHGACGGDASYIDCIAWLLQLFTHET